MLQKRGKGKVSHPTGKTMCVHCPLGGPTHNRLTVALNSLEIPTVRPLLPRKTHWTRLPRLLRADHSLVLRRDTCLNEGAETTVPLALPTNGWRHLLQRSAIHLLKIPVQPSHKNKTRLLPQVRLNAACPRYLPCIVTT
jgi:hypothetical protein